MSEKLPAMIKKLRSNAPLILILCAGLWIRFLDLGKQSFWLDEAGVAIAASQPTLEKALEIAQTHAAAMPLDYVIAWGMARVSLGEGWLRIPSALWGIAGVWIVYCVTKKMSGEAPALIAAGLLTLAPAHIHLSQELRFYAALFFFYWLLTGLLFSAQKQPGWQNWAKVVAIATLGAYFHLYTLLAFVNGLAFLLLRYNKTPSWISSLRRLFVSGLLTALLVLPGFLHFGMESKSGYIIQWNMVPGQILIALGWLPIYGTPLGVTFGLLLLPIAIPGIWNAFRNEEGPIFALLLSTGLQVGLITLTDVVNGYFIAWRQYYFLLPVSFMLVGIALGALFRRSNPLLSQAKSIVNVKPVNQFLAGLILLMLLSLNLATFVDNRQFVKSNGREIAYQLHQIWQPGDQFWTIPAYETQLYQFYWDNVLQDRSILNQMKGIQWEKLPELTSQPGRVYLSIRSPLARDRMEYLQSNRFKLINGIENPQMLWVRSP